MFGGVATICPECCYQWTLSPVVSISWFCPKCGGARDNDTFRNLCVCGHAYAQHHTMQEVKPSRAAFGMSIAELDKVDEILATEPEPPPEIGECNVCICRRFDLDPPKLPAKCFLNEVDRTARRGAAGRETKVTKVAEGTLDFSKGARSVRLSLQPDDSILMEEFDGERPTPRVLSMGRDTVGMTAIAIHESLR
jgi:hypothetical protein